MARTVAHVWAELQRKCRLAGRHLRYGRASWAGAASPEKEEALRHLFGVVNGHLARLGCEHLIVYGTLLGWHRDGGLLPHDVDVDFGAPVALYPKIRDSAAALPAGFTLHDTSHRHRGPKLYVEHGGWEADIYFFTERDGRLLPDLISNEPGDHVPFPREWFFPRQAATFLGEATFVPAQPVAYLEHLYRYLGPDAEQDPVTRYYRPRQR
jgi:hypothetical protein